MGANGAGAIEDSTTALRSSHTRVPSVRAVLRSAHSDEVALLGMVGLAVQMAFPHRHDWAAHLVAGGGAVLALASVVPAQIARWTGAAAFGVVAAMGWVGELTAFGPPDATDVAVTLAGALLVVDAADRIAAEPRPARRAAGAWGVALVVTGLTYRYRLSATGP